MDTIELHIQLDIDKTASGKKRTKCTLVSTPIKERYTTTVGLIAYHQGETRNGFTPAIDQRHLLIAYLYWTPESFRNKTTLNVISQRLFTAIKGMIDSRDWQCNTIRLKAEGWRIQEYWTLE